MNSAYLSPIAKHLWQSTLFAVFAGLLILLLRSNRARVRHWIWIAASWKFLVRFYSRSTLGGHIHWRTPPRREHPSLSVVVEVSQPSTASAPSSAPMSASGGGAHASGASIFRSFYGPLGVWIPWIGSPGGIRWRRIRAIVRPARRSSGNTDQGRVLCSALRAGCFRRVPADHAVARRHR